MNERIRKLVKQAEEYAHNRMAEIGGSYLEYYNEKFAELIVKECAGVTLDYKNHDHYTGWCDHASEILKHFGVE